MSNSASSSVEVPARPWRQVDAQRWVDARPPRWLRPGLPALLLVAAAIAAVAQTPDPVCSVQAPCGEQWFDAVGTMLILPYLVSLFMLPEVAVVTAPLLIVYSAQPQEWVGGAGENISVGGIIAALGWGWGVGAARLRARRRQRVLVREAAGGLTAFAPMPADASPRQHGLIRLVAAVLMGASAAGLITSVVADDRAIDRAVRASTVRDVPVVGYSADDSTLTVRLPDGRRHTFDVNGTYRDVSTVRVLLQGRSVRLAAEPYGDHFVRQALGLGLAGLGVIAGMSALLARRRAVALAGAAVPVMRVRARQNGGMTELFAFDDTAGLRPVLRFVGHGKVHGPLGTATAYGALSEGGTVVLDRPAGPDGVRLTEVALSPIAPERPAGPAGRRDRGGSRPPRRPARREAEHDRAMEALTQEAMSRMTPAAAPVRWKAGPVARWAGVALVLIAVAVSVGAVDAHARVPLAFFWVIVLMLLNGLHRLGTWEITADAEGLRLGVLWSSKELVPWNLVGTARYSAFGELIIERGDMATEIRLGVVGSPSMERRLRRPGRAAQAAAEITAMIRDPRLRPAAPL
ncbi:hypothetical protein [Actinacidiphila acidipaludis]|uniref:PH domain-containing protein n=1 Tax=Actinacidiphila acidipaludis TaxID=2873382 RepID=A0ABS7Q313_9ACTN|nr:hypothetical protein [Streptomyces acidipaludis]MBY8876164.1 hypothetical protein [Streptomyces acidipaludis]